MLKILTSQLKLIPGREEALSEYEISSALIFKNEPFSFQLIYSHDCNFQPLSLDVDSPLPAEAFRVDCVPICNAANDYDEPGYITSDPGIVPDLLRSRPLKPKIISFDAAINDVVLNNTKVYLEENVDVTLNATRAAQAVLITVNPDGEMLSAGKYKLSFKLTEITKLTEFATAELEIEVIDAALPTQDFCVTNWFHVDCLCEFYGCEPYSERFYTIFKSFIKNAARHRQNTLILPAFTPALDTPIGGVRRNVQLVDVWRDGEEWCFDFSRLGKYMRIAAECGIKYFEHCHIFSQWGAVKTPTIYDKDGNKLFGWDTESVNAEYREFIRKYLKEYIAFARSEGYSDDRLIFHISDEPFKHMIEEYRLACNTVSDILAPFTCIDALEELEFYREGLVKTPVANVEHAEAFSKECSSYWMYYTCGTYVRECTSRLITQTADRTRVLGIQMYKYRADGFLHWGYNYYFDRMSEGFFDPKADPCGYKKLPGCSYLAYPEKDGATPSLREIYMREAFDDLRALKLYESLTSRSEAEKLIESLLGNLNMHTIPKVNTLYKFSQALKQKIKNL